MNKMKQILVNTYLSKDEGIAGVMAAEYEMTNSWRDKGIIEHLFAKENKGGAVLTFNESDEQKVRELIEQLPLFPFFEKVEYLPLDKLY